MNKVIIITGGSRGIGAATALLAADEGYAICINYVNNKQAANSLAEAINKKGLKAIAVAANVAVETEVVRLFETTDAELGTVTALVNNAGIIAHQSLIKDMNAQRLQHVFSTNIVGPFLCAREAVRRMSYSSGGKGGAIVNISSAATKHGAAFEYVDYAASKGALDMLTLGLSKEVAAEGIRVNSVRPGLIYTDIHASAGEPNRVDRLRDVVPMKRGGQPQEVAKAVLWLLSEEASYVTGATLDVTGGR